MTTTREEENNLRAVAEELFGYSPCLHCTLFDLIVEDSDEVKCEVFPVGFKAKEEDC